MSLYERKLPEPEFALGDLTEYVDAELIQRLNQERIRLRSWLSYLLEWGRQEEATKDDDVAPVRPMLNRAQVIDATETALTSGDWNPML